MFSIWFPRAEARGWVGFINPAIGNLACWVDEANPAYALSEQRASSVGSYLMGRGLNRERFITVGAGEDRPVGSNDSESGRAQNRRVEITLVPVRS